MGTLVTLRWTPPRVPRYRRRMNALRFALLSLALSACSSDPTPSPVRADSGIDAPEVADVLPADAPDATMDGGPEDAGTADAE